MLFLVGVGLTGKDLSLSAIEACRNSELFVDRYTSRITDEHIDFIRSAVGKQAKELGRQELEEGARDIVARARFSNVAVLVGGDPLMATTHKILFIEAQKQKVGIQVVHSSSIISAAMGESGLDFYRFGQIATIPRWSEHYEPVSFYETIKRNMANSEHSLLLLDFDLKTMSSLPVREAIGTLEKAEASYRSGIVTDSTKLLILNSMASDVQQRLFATLAKARELRLEGTSVIIIPAELTDIEKEAVMSMCRVLG